MDPTRTGNLQFKRLLLYTIELPWQGEMAWTRLERATDSRKGDTVALPIELPCLRSMDRARTGNPQFRKLMLRQLSYHTLLSPCVVKAALACKAAWNGEDFLFALVLCARNGFRLARLKLSMCASLKSFYWTHISPMQARLKNA